MSKKIVLCKNCNGSGIVTVFCGDNHKSDYRDKPCNNCKGSGRMLKTKDVSYEPYGEIK